jgi:hypothetical protein
VLPGAKFRYGGAALPPRFEARIADDKVTRDFADGVGASLI